MIDKETLLQTILKSLDNTLDLKFVEKDALVLEHNNEYTSNDSKDLKSTTSKKIKDYLKNSSNQGVYIYFDYYNGECLYVGKAKNLHSRIYCHYKESIFREHDGKKGMGGDIKTGIWPRFFQTKGYEKVLIYCLDIKGEADVYTERKRKGVEAILHASLKPRFIEHKLNFYKH